MSGSPEAWKLPGRASLFVAPVYEAHGLFLSTVTCWARLGPSPRDPFRLRLLPPTAVKNHPM
eukprot:4381138-Prymnesium_polylepis.1